MSSRAQVPRPAITLAVAVPQTLGPSRRMRVQAPDGRLVDVIVPPSLRPGQQLHVQFPAERSIAEELLVTFVNGLADRGSPFVFEAANGYSVSAKGLSVGFQLTNAARDKDRFRVHRVAGAGGVFVFESLSSPGCYVGVGPEQGVAASSRAATAVLARGGGANESEQRERQFRVVSARNGSELQMSLEAVARPGELLNHSNGLMWLKREGANVSESIFSKDASWRLVAAEETAEEQAGRLPVVARERSENSTGCCPVCFEPWGPAAPQVVTDCDHTYCIKCVVGICQMSPPSTTGTCAICRGRVTLAGLRRVAAPAAPPADPADPDGGSSVVGELSEELQLLSFRDGAELGRPDLVRELMAMGFGQAACETALQRADGSMEAAVEMLLQGS